MKSSTRDNVEGKLHQAKGKIKESVGKLFKNRDLEAEGTVENLDGKVQEKVGQLKKVVDDL
ncbi:MAG: CsbD family protein [Desulfobacteraceae bacterium]|nr:MAG: CsbD family protein [Desulfobacteraceae bacterium]